MAENLKYLKKEACDKLRDSIAENADNYCSKDNSWVKRFLGHNLADYTRVSSIKIEDINFTYIDVLKTTDEGKCMADIANALEIYQKLHLTRYQATSPEFWTYLCHVVKKVYNYLQNRWLSDPRENTIRTRFFVLAFEKLRNDNGISRLFWAALLTYDPDNKDDPFHLTRILLQLQANATDILDTNHRLRLRRIRPVLLAIRAFIAMKGNRAGLQNSVRAGIKYLNHDAALRSYDVVDEAEIYNMMLEQLVDFRIAELLTQTSKKSKAELESIMQNKENYVEYRPYGKEYIQSKV